MSAGHSDLGVSCAHCNDTRSIWNGFLRKNIRCPRCTARERRPDPATAERVLREVGKTLSPSERRRWASKIDAILIDATINAFRFDGLPEHLVVTDRILQRWNAAPTGMPAENADVYHRSRPPPLDAMTQEAVTDILKASPRGVFHWSYRNGSIIPAWRRCGFVQQWYCFDDWLSTDEIAQAKGMSLRQLGREWENVLIILRERFRESAHADLARLVRAQP